MNLPKLVQISEIGPSDGLQNIQKFIPTKEKIRFIKLLKDAGCRNIEITSFVSPKWINQMKDVPEIVHRFTSNSAIHYCVLVPNKKGLELALEAGAKEVVGFLSASEIHNEKNVNKTIDESLNELVTMISLAKKAILRLEQILQQYLGTILKIKSMTMWLRYQKPLRMQDTKVSHFTIQ